MNHVNDDRDNSHSPMASWYGYFVYDGRTYPYTPRNCYHCIFSKSNNLR